LSYYFKTNEIEILVKYLGENIFDVLSDFYLSKNGFEFLKKDLSLNKNEVYMIDFFTDVICCLSPRSLSKSSYIWPLYTLQYSDYPVLTLISSDKSAKNKIPTYNIIKELIHDMNIHLNNIQYNKYCENYYCIPHTIECSLEPVISTYEIEKWYRCFNYLSFENKYSMPIFVTSDSVNNGYRISINSEELLMMDVIILNDKEKEIFIPYYKFNINKNFLNVQNKLMSYAFYFAKKNLKMIEPLNQELPQKKLSLRNNFVYENQEKEMEYFVLSIFYNKMNEINGNICEKTKDAMIYIIFFITIALNMLQSKNDVKNYLLDYSKKTDYIVNNNNNKEKFESLVQEIIQNVIKNKENKKFINIEDIKEIKDNEDSNKNKRPISEEEIIENNIEIKRKK